ncbi:MAG TPA: lipid kinase YegS [Desulfobulbus sp.]|nr:lipid kinase YegS [Desulfobulbus sp.]
MQQPFRTDAQSDRRQPLVDTSAKGCLTSSCTLPGNGLVLPSLCGILQRQEPRPSSSGIKQMSSQIRIILNGKSADSAELREAVYTQRQKSISIDVRVTWEQGDAARFVQEACRQGVKKIISAGGDGTLHEVVNALCTCESASDRPLLGIIPMGTANDFAGSCNLPRLPADALHLAVTSGAVPIDVIQINDRYLLNVATSGFGAEVTVATPPELKRFLGGASYALMGIILSMNLQPHDGEILLPNSKKYKGAVLVGAVGNGRQAGGGIPLTPKAYIDDGLLDLLYIRRFPLTDLGTVIQELSSLPSEGKYVGYIQTPWFEFDHLHPINVNLDGESYSFKKGRAELIPGALQVILPMNCPLLVANRD